MQLRSPAHAHLKTRKADGVVFVRTVYRRDVASLRQVHKKLADGTFGAEEGGAEGGLKTSGSRAMDAYRMKQTGATATFDPTRGGAKVNRCNICWR